MNLNQKYKYFLFEEDDGLGLTGGSGSGEQEEKETQVVENKSPSIDAKAFAEQFGEVLANKFKERDDNSQRQSQQNRQPTAEERALARKQFGMVDIDDETLAALDNLETRKGTWQKLVDRIYESTTNITEAHIARINKAWEEKFQPVEQHFTRSQIEAQASRFHKAYPDLADENLAPILAGVGAKLQEQGAFNGLSESQSFDKLAQGVESVLKYKNPQFTLTKNNTSGKSSNEIPVESSGGRGGGGQTGGSVKADSPNGLFGPVKARK